MKIRAKQYVFARILNVLRENRAQKALFARICAEVPLMRSA